MTRRAFLILGLLCPTLLHALEIRVAPPDKVFVNDSARRVGISDVMLHGVAVINDGPDDVELQRMEITAFRYGQPVLTDAIAFEHYQLRWKGLEEYFDTPGTMASQDSIYLFSMLLAGGVELSPTMSLRPGTGVIVQKRLLSFSDYQRPDVLRIHASAVSKDGRSHTAETELAIVRYKPENAYRLPLEGRWYVAASSSSRSHHRMRPAHEFALDLIKIGDGGSSFRTDGSTPEDYYAFGQDVVAAAGGTVVRAVGDVPETEMPRPSESRRDFAVRVLDAMWRKDPSGRVAEGNLVVIEHAGGEHSVYVHLKHGSLKVKRGDVVRRGQVIGRVGISGDGFQPHLHFQVNDGPDPQLSRGLPVIFDNVRPVPFSSTLDMKADRLYMAGEFIETVAVTTSPPSDE